MDMKNRIEKASTMQGLCNFANDRHIDIDKLNIFKELAQKYNFSLKDFQCSQNGWEMKNAI